MTERYRVRVTKDYLVFSAGHFITYCDNLCERLHGHNYRVTAEVAGPLDGNHYVVDFILLRDLLKEIVDRLDHRMLLPTLHPTIRVTTEAGEVTAQFEDRRWVFPEADCVLLPVPNTTSELLARYIGQQLLTALSEKGAVQPERLWVEVDECFGQTAICELTSDGL